VEECTKTRKAELNLVTKEKKVLEKEMKLTQFVYKGKPHVRRIEVKVCD